VSATRVPFFDRTRGDAALSGELTAAFLRVLRSGQYILGREVEALEAACAGYLGVRHAIGVSSGSDALALALLALGIGPGDEVICPAYTFFATASAIVRLGAVPVFVDIDPDTYLVDPASVAARLSPRTRAIVPVHLFGQCADLDALAALCDVPIIEDAAQAIGTARGDRRAGSMGTFGCFSFYPSKNLGGFGDGGLVTTRDDALADRARILRAHGAMPKHHHAQVGYNFRLDALQAALLHVKLPGLDALIARRAAVAARYAALFQEAGLAGPNGAPGDSPLGLPRMGPGVTFNQFVIRVRGAGTRDRLRAFLGERGIGTEVYYPVPLHRQPCFAALGYAEGSMPFAEAAAKETLALPIFPELTEDEIAYVTDAVRAFYRG
jgi:dTDP-4-amino-4,6-dideoxygalactose transaminase